MSEEEEEILDVPLQDLRPFYRSRARQELTFIRAGSDPEVPKASQPSNRAADAYAAIVLKDQPLHSILSQSSVPQVSITDKDVPTEARAVCEVCGLPVEADNATGGTPHAASLAHQVCLTHSHPPSHLDRDHIGLRYMTTYGWDPDARVGLGAEGTGIRAPIKAVKKNDTAGLGLAFTKKIKDVPVKSEMLDAGKVRKQHAESRRKEARLREMFYGDDKIAKYLGERDG